MIMNTQHSKQTIKAYDQNAKNYADKFDNYEVYQRKISDFWQKHIAKGSHILDLGCGPANNISTILQHDASCSFDGVDLSQTFIELAQQRFPQFRFHQQDICNLDLESQYHVVIASFCIVHLTDQEATKFLEDLAMLTAANGYLYLSYMNGSGSGLESTSFSEEEIFFNYYQDNFIIELLETNNFEIVEISKEEYLESDGAITIDSFIYAKKR